MQQGFSILLTLGHIKGILEQDAEDREIFQTDICVSVCVLTVRDRWARDVRVIRAAWEST